MLNDCIEPFGNRKVFLRRIFSHRCDQVLNAIPTDLSTQAVDVMFKRLKFSGCFRDGLVVIFKEKLVSFPHLIFILIQGCLALNFAVLYGMYLDIALSSSEIMFPHSLFTGVNI